MDLNNYSDDELREKLLEYGVPVSSVPISSSREYFERKLTKLMGGNIADSFSGEVDEDDDINISPKRNLRSKSSKERTTPSPKKLQNVRFRSNIDSLAFDPDRHTPSPRPSLRTISKNTRVPYGSDDVDGGFEDKGGFSCKRFLVKWIIILILVGAVYAAYVYVYSENPLKGLEDMAREVYNSAGGDAPPTSTPAPHSTPPPPRPSGKVPKTPK